MAAGLKSIPGRFAAEGRRLLQINKLLEERRRMINRHYFIAVKLKGSDVHASGVITVRSFFRQNTESLFENSKRKIAERCGLRVEDFVSVAFNRI